ncbi:MAG: guanylate kinase [Cyanobacteria bacterium P01_A01_bin.17]
MSGLLVVLTGPSGVGKGTLLQALLQRHPDIYVSVSATTRSPRPGEVDGQHYYFWTPEKFQAMIAAGAFFEWAQFTGNFYGTPRAPVMQRVAQGQRVILEIELEGARQVRKTAPDAFQIFILPPSVEELERRIRDRGQDDEGAIARRLARAKVELAAADEFDLQIMNDDLPTALSALESALLDSQ